MNDSTKAKTHLYLVARWGNDNEGPNGKDTLFLVAADSHLVAGRTVDRVLADLPSTKVRPEANWICLLGDASEESNFGGVLKGPYLDQAGIRGCSVFWSREPWQKRWQRKTTKSD